MGLSILTIALTAHGFLLLVAWQLHAKRPTFDNIALTLFSLSASYNSFVLLLTVLMPLTVVYNHFDMLEQLHRSRYLLLIVSHCPASSGCCSSTSSASTRA